MGDQHVRGATAGGPEVSVVIPTLNRRAALLETLAALRGQDLAPGTMEIIVVDNGSTDGTRAALSDWDGAAVPLTVLSEPRRGPAAARNRGVAAARGALVLFLGDDMRAAGSGFVAGHVTLHAEHPDELDGVLGRVTWRPDRPVSRFMHWLEHGGPQFRFDELAKGPQPPAAALATPNVSLKTALLQRLGGFDARFPAAAMEDVEFGLRMQRAGGRLWYAPELLVHHDHPQTVARWMRRERSAGAAAALLHTLWPGTEADATRIRLPDWRWPLLRVGRPLLAAASRAPLPPRLAPSVWKAACVASYADGYRNASELIPALSDPELAHL